MIGVDNVSRLRVSFTTYSGSARFFVAFGNFVTVNFIFFNKKRHTMETTTTSSEINQQIEQLEKEIQSKRKALVQLKRQQMRNTELQDYTFTRGDGQKVKLSELFGDSDELLIIHNMGRSCRYCTLWADELNGVHKPLASRVPFAVTTPDDPEVMQEFAKSRNWQFNILSTKGTSFKKDTGFEKDGAYYPGFSVFTEDADSTIRYAAKDWFGPGDVYCSVWHFFELLPKGVDNWQPKFEYA